MCKCGDEQSVVTVMGFFALVGSSAAEHIYTPVIVVVELGQKQRVASCAVEHKGRV